MSDEIDDGIDKAEKGLDELYGPPGTPAVVHSLWVEEIEARMAAIERGEVEWIPGEKLVEQLKKKCGSPE
ncbi:MAG TPA: addiction module protein [Gemmataceae bacterium]|nr:addiction module protein [Gemmataceae bacterium]